MKTTNYKAKTITRYTKLPAHIAEALVEKFDNPKLSIQAHMVVAQAFPRTLGERSGWTPERLEIASKELLYWDAKLAHLSPSGVGQFGTGDQGESGGPGARAPEPPFDLYTPPGGR